MNKDKSKNFIQDHKRQKGEDYQEIQKLYQMCEQNKPSKVLKSFYIKFKNQEFSKQNLKNLISEVAKRNQKNFQLLQNQEIDADSNQKLVNFQKMYEEQKFDANKNYPNSRKNHFYFIKQLILEEMNYKDIKLLLNKSKNEQTIKQIKLPHTKSNNYEVQDLTKAKVHAIEKNIYKALKEFDLEERRKRKQNQQENSNPDANGSNVSFQNDNDSFMEDKKDNLNKDPNRNLDQDNNPDQICFDQNDPLKKYASQKRFEINKDEYDYALETDAQDTQELIHDIKLRKSIKQNIKNNMNDSQNDIQQNIKLEFDPNQSFGETSKKMTNLEDKMNDNLDALDSHILNPDRKLANVQEHKQTIETQQKNLKNDESFDEKTISDQNEKQEIFESDQKMNDSSQNSKDNSQLTKEKKLTQNQQSKLKDDDKISNHSSQKILDKENLQQQKSGKQQNHSLNQENQIVQNDLSDYQEENSFGKGNFQNDQNQNKEDEDLQTTPQYFLVDSDNKVKDLSEKQKNKLNQGEDLSDLDNSYNQLLNQQSQFSVYKISETLKKLKSMKWITFKSNYQSVVSISEKSFCTFRSNLMSTLKILSIKKSRTLSLLLAYSLSFIFLVSLTSFSNSSKLFVFLEICSQNSFSFVFQKDSISISASLIAWPKMVSLFSSAILIVLLASSSALNKLLRLC